jgi:hypothetical protein
MFLSREKRSRGRPDEHREDVCNSISDVSDYYDKRKTLTGSLFLVRFKYVEFRMPMSERDKDSGKADQILVEGSPKIPFWAGETPVTRSGLLCHCQKEGGSFIFFVLIPMMQ